MNEIFVKNCGLILNGNTCVICNNCTIFTDFQVIEFETKEAAEKYASDTNLIIENNDNGII
jgi:Fe-S-cluster-containing hydrogenase component 2